MEIPFGFAGIQALLTTLQFEIQQKYSPCGKSIVSIAKAAMQNMIPRTCDDVQCWVNSHAILFSFSNT